MMEGNEDISEEGSSNAENPDAVTVNGNEFDESIEDKDLFEEPIDNNNDNDNKEEETKEV